jgi:hypothetical protein
VIVISPSFSGKSYWEHIDILTEAIYKVLSPIEASAFTPEEWKTKKSLIVDYAKNGILVELYNATQNYLSFWRSYVSEEKEEALSAVCSASKTHVCL